MTGLAPERAVSTAGASFHAACRLWDTPAAQLAQVRATLTTRAGRVARAGHGAILRGKGGRARATARTASRRRASVTAAGAHSHATLLGCARRAVPFDLAFRALGRRDTASDSCRPLAADGVRRAFLDESGAALVGEDRVRLQRRAAHVGAVGRRRGTVTVGRDRRPCVGDVAHVRVGRGVAPGVTRNGTSDHSEERRETEPRN